jgi:hypothetical protein
VGSNKIEGELSDEVFDQGVKCPQILPKPRFDNQIFWDLWSKQFEGHREITGSILEGKTESCRPRFDN